MPQKTMRKPASSTRKPSARNAVKKPASSMRKPSAKNGVQKPASSMRKPSAKNGVQKKPAKTTFREDPQAGKVFSNSLLHCIYIYISIYIYPLLYIYITFIFCSGRIGQWCGWPEWHWNVYGWSVSHSMLPNLAVVEGHGVVQQEPLCNSRHFMAYLSWRPNDALRMDLLCWSMEKGTKRPFSYGLYEWARPHACRLWCHEWWFQLRIIYMFLGAGRLGYVRQRMVIPKYDIYWYIVFQQSICLTLSSMMFSFSKNS